MANRAIFYISAASDLGMEREILGRLVTEIPVDLAWRVVQSPTGNGPLDLEALLEADVHVVLLGTDIRAPVGLEWQMARQAGRKPIALLKEETLRTPAAQEFTRLVSRVQSWDHFRDNVELRRKVLVTLVDYLLAHGTRFSLQPEEVAKLRGWRAEVLSESGAVDETTRGGAGDSSVVLSRKRFVPSDGVVLGES